MDVAISISQMRKLGLRTFGNLPKHIVITCVPNAAAAAAAACWSMDQLWVARAQTAARQGSKPGDLI